MTVKYRSPWRRLESLRSRDPLRPVDWRLKLAIKLHAAGYRSPSQTNRDPWLFRAVRYLRRGSHIRRSNRSVLEAEPAVARALSVRHVGTCRVELEARLLAGLPTGSVASALDLPPEVVEAYAALCFDVLGRLGAMSYILRAAVGLREPVGFPLGDIGVLARYAAYSGGPHVLETSLAALGLRPAGGFDPSLIAGARVWFDALQLSMSGDPARLTVRAALRALEVDGAIPASPGSSSIIWPAHAMPVRQPANSTAVGRAGLAADGLDDAGRSVA